MRKVYSGYDGIMVGFLKSVLEDHRIPCFVKREFLASGAGEIPPNECWPELCVTDDRDYDRAKEIIELALATDHHSNQTWQCPRCEEIIEGQFTDCWQCGEVRPG